MHNVDDLIMCLVNYNGHAYRHIYGFSVIHEGYVVGQRNLELRVLLWLCVLKQCCVLKTWLKREKKSRETFILEGNEKGFTAHRCVLKT